MTSFDLKKVDPRSRNFHQKEFLCELTHPPSLVFLALLGDEIDSIGGSIIHMLTPFRVHNSQTLSSVCVEKKMTSNKVSTFSSNISSPPEHTSLSAQLNNLFLYLCCQLEAQIKLLATGNIYIHANDTTMQESVSSVGNPCHCLPGTTRIAHRDLRCKIQHSVTLSNKILNYQRRL